MICHMGLSRIKSVPVVAVFRADRAAFWHASASSLSVVIYIVIDTCCTPMIAYFGDSLFEGPEMKLALLNASSGPARMACAMKYDRARGRYERTPEASEGASSSTA